MNETRSKVKRQIWIWGNGCRKKENDFLGFTRKILVESTEMCYDTSVEKIYMQIWFIGRTLASQAGKAGSIPVICFFDGCGNPCKCWIFPLFTRVSGVFGASTTKAYFSIKDPFLWGNITRNITRKKGCFSFIFKE